MPCAGAEEVSHFTMLLSIHVAAVRTPRLQLDAPDTVYPLSQVGWHAVPDARLERQVPMTPFVGAAEASQGEGEHVAVVSTPRLQLEGPDMV